MYYCLCTLVRRHFIILNTFTAGDFIWTYAALKSTAEFNDTHIEFQEKINLSINKVTDEFSLLRFMWKPKLMPVVRPYKIFPRCFYKIFRRFDISQLYTLMMPFDMIQEVQTTGGRNAEYTETFFFLSRYQSIRKDWFFFCSVGQPVTRCRSSRQMCRPDGRQFLYLSVYNPIH